MAIGTDVIKTPGAPHRTAVGDANPTTTGAVNAANPVGGLTGTNTCFESSLSKWAEEYVTDFLGKGRAVSDTTYEAYQGPLTAVASNLQSHAFQE